MSTLDLEPIKERLAAATPGPWRVWHDPDPSKAGTAVETAWCYGDIEGDTELITDYLPTGADAEMIAHAPEDIAALVAEVEQLRAERDGDGDVESGRSGMHSGTCRDCETSCIRSKRYAGKRRSDAKASKLRSTPWMGCTARRRSTTPSRTTARSMTPRSTPSRAWIVRWLAHPRFRVLTGDTGNPHQHGHWWGFSGLR